MKVVVIFIIAVPNLSLQRHTDSCSDELDASLQDYDYSPTYYRAEPRKHKHKKHSDRSAELEASNSKFVAKHATRSARKHSISRHKKHPKKGSVTYSDNCFCDCQKCDEQQQCCQTMCNSECDDQTDQSNLVDSPQPGLSPGNLVFVPYPYPLVVPAPAQSPQFPSGVQTSTMPPTMSTEPYTRYVRSQPSNDHFLELVQALKHKPEAPYLRDQLSLRPGKQHILEYRDLSDHLLDRLLSQVRSVKDINPPRQ